MATLDLTAITTAITFEVASHYYYYDVGGSDQYTNDVVDIDLVLLGSAGDTVNGINHTAALTVEGNGGNDLLKGTEFADTLDGGADNDTLETGGGADTLTGGSGNDIFVIQKLLPSSYDSMSEARTVTITDFAAGDKLDLSEIGITSLTDLAAFESSAGGLELTFWVNGYEQKIFLDGVPQTVNDLTSSAFIFSTSIVGVSITGTEDRDDLFGRNGEDYLYGYGGLDRIYGAGGNDSVYGYDGADILRGGAGSDAIDGGNDGDDIDAGVGNDDALGGDGDDVISGGDGNDHLYGEVVEANWSSLWNDILDGGIGDDFLAGGGGDDTLTGGAGIDTFRLDYVRYFNYSGSGLTSDTLDTVTDFTSSDRIDFSSLGISELETARYLLSTLADGMLLTAWVNGYKTEMKLTGAVTDPATIGTGNVVLSNVTQNDSISGTDSRDDIFGGRGDDALYAYGDVDRIFGESGNDIIDGGAGEDLLSGGAGSDDIDGDVDNDQVDGGAGNDTIIGGEGEDLLTGGDDSDVISGDEEMTNWQQSFSDTLSGGAGNDTLAGGGGNDTLTGGSGTDNFRLSYGYYWGYGGQSLSGDTTDTVTDYDFATDRIDLTEARISDLATVKLLIELDGGGTTSSVVVYQNGYRTVLSLGALVDVSLLTTAKVVLSTNTSADSYSGTENRDDLFGGLGDDNISGLGDADRLFGEGGNDTLYGYDGEDRLYGGAGTDQIDAGVDNDHVEGGDGQDTVLGREGEDTIIGGADNDTLTGDDEQTNWQQAFNDTLEGGTGNDTLAGGGGDDALSGGAGADNFRLSFGYYWGYGGQSLAGDTTDTVTDFDFATDKIDFSEARISDLATAKLLIALDEGGATSSVVVYQNGYKTSLSLGVLVDPATLTAAKVVLSTNTAGEGFSGTENRDDLFGGLGDDSISGLGETDRLFGEGGNDTLNGNDGDDQLYGGAGTDTIDAGLGDDQIDAGDGQDNASGGEGKDTLLGGADNDVLLGESNQTNWQQAFDDTLNGGVGNDTLAGGAGDDTLTGGTGTDAFRISYGFYWNYGGQSLAGDTTDTATDYDFATDRIDFTEAGISDLATAQALIELDQGGATSSVVVYQNGYRTGLSLGALVNGSSLTAAKVVLSTSTDARFYAGTEQRDDLFGGLGNDNISGAGGTDRLFGENGNDALSGGAQDDRVLGGGGSDNLAGDAGNDIVEGGAGIDNALGGVGIDTLRGGDDADVLFGDNETTAWNLVFNDTLEGGAGDDVLAGGAGNDGLTGGAGSDAFRIAYSRDGWANLLAANTTDTVTDWGSTDKIDVSEMRITEVETLLALLEETASGVTVVSRMNGYLNTLLLSGLASAAGITAANVVLDENNDAEFIGGGNQADDFFAGGGDDNVTGGGGNDRIFGEAGNDNLAGGTGIDFIDGSGGTDTIAGDAGDDTVRGGVGDDTLAGAIGIDTIGGGDGNDRVFGDATSEDEQNATVATEWAESYDDVLSGDAGNDLLAGAGGDDKLTGGAGVDTYQMAGNRFENMIENSTDTVTDWSTATDKVDLRELGISDVFTAQQLLSIEGGVLSVLTRQNGFLNKMALGSSAAAGTLAAANFVLSTSITNDFLNGTNNIDYLFGGRGNDTLNAANNNDWLFGEIGNDTLDGGAGIDTIWGGAGTDRIEGGDGTDAIDGGADNDVISGGAGSDSMTGGTGADDFVMGSWTGFIDEQNEYGLGVSKGGAVIQDFKVSELDQIDLRQLGIQNFDSLNYFWKDLGNDGAIDISLYGFTQRITVKGVDTLAELGRASFVFDTSLVADRYVGSIVADIIALGAGNDQATGGNGADTLLGEDGNDTLQGGNDNDTILGGAGTDSLSGDVGNDNMLGGDGIDTINGGAGTDTLRGDAGNDNMLGADGNDALAGGNDNDTLNGGSGIDNLAGDAGNDNMLGGNDNDTINGGVGNDTLSGDAGNDNMQGGDGVDSLNGGAGTDTLAGGRGNDTYAVDSAADRINETGGDGVDTVRSSVNLSLAASANMLGAVENLTLLGSAATATGNAVANVLVGNAVANTLNGAAGIDTLTGGAGNDFFVFNSALNAASNVDRLTDFNAVGNDTMRLENAIFAKIGAVAGALNAQFFKVGAAATDANDYIVYNQASGSLFYDSNGNLAGGAVQFATLISRPTLTAADFAVI